MTEPSSVDDPIEARWSARVGPEEHLILPDGCVDVLERDGQLWVIGPMTRAKRVSFAASPPRGIRFRAATVRQWLGISPEEIIDATIPAVELPSLRDVLSLADVTDLVRGSMGPPRIMWAVRQLQRAPNTSVKELATTLGITERHFRRLFRVETGLSPKLFARIQRLQHFHLALEKQSPLPPLVELAYCLGYADQAHMSKEVKALAGLSPTAFVRWMSDLYKTGV